MRDRADIEDLELTRVMRQPRRATFTYALLDGRRVKIGISADIQSRVRDHKVSNPFYRLARTWRGRELERLVMKELEFCRVNGSEWYCI